MYSLIFCWKNKTKQPTGWYRLAETAKSCYDHHMDACCLRTTPTPQLPQGSFYEHHYEMLWNWLVGSGSLKIYAE